MENKQWKLEPHSYQIADTGDYDGHYELSNGEITLITQDDVELTDPETSMMVWALSQYKWHCVETDNVSYGLHLAQGKIERMKKFMKAIGIHELLIDKVEYVGADGLDIIAAIENIRNASK